MLPKRTTRPGDEEVPTPVLDAKLLSQLQKQSKRLTVNRKRVANARSAAFASVKKAYTYVARPDGTPAVGFSGVSVRAMVVVTSDRRFVRLKITQAAVKLRGIGKRSSFDPVSGKEGVIEVPDVEERTTVSTIVVADGHAAVVQVPGAETAANRVQYLLIQPRIHIEAEQKVRTARP